MAQKIDYSQTIPVMQIRPGGIIFYDARLYYKSKNQDSTFEFESKSPAAEKYTGKLNHTSTKKLRNAINLLIAQAHTKTAPIPNTDKVFTFKVNFITLTLSAPQFDVSDREIKNQILARWILNMKRNFGLRSYVWRAERQQNGNIHFHFVTDTFIPYDSIRDAWNHEQGKYHFIEVFRYKNKSAFPNSTDVHAIKKIKNLAAYIVKYMSKDAKSVDTIDGKVWDCSMNLKGIHYPAFEMSCSDFQFSEMIHEKYKDRLRSSDFCSFIPLNDFEMKHSLPRDKLKAYSDFLQEVYNKANS